MRNAKAVLSILVGLLALVILMAGGGAAHLREEIGLEEAVGVVPGGFVLALIALSLARRARFDYQRTLGRIGGHGAAGFGRLLGLTALLGSLTAALALGVYYALTVYRS